MEVPLLNQIMNDGSRQFAALPESQSWEQLREHIARLGGAQVTGFVTDGVTEMWIDFTFHGHRFSINNQFGEYWFFVEDPQCDEGTLNIVAAHCASFPGRDQSDFKHSIPNAAEKGGI